MNERHGKLVVGDAMLEQARIILNSIGEVKMNSQEDVFVAFRSIVHFSKLKLELILEDSGKSDSEHVRMENIFGTFIEFFENILVVLYQKID